MTSPKNYTHHINKPYKFQNQKWTAQKKQTPTQWNTLAENTWKKHHLNTIYLEKSIHTEQKQQIPHNTIHKIILQKDYAKKQPSKQKKRRPRVHYKREHSLS